MAKKSDSIASGSILTDFTFVSYDEDTGRMLIKKQFDDGSEWLEPVAISIPDLFFMFKTEGVDPTEMTDEFCFEFHKVSVEIGSLIQAPFDDDFNACPDSYYYQIKAIRS